MSKKTLIVGLGHRRGVGKDTIAGILYSEFARDFTINTSDFYVSRDSFAWTLKEVAFQLYQPFGMPEPDTMFDQNTKNLFLPKLGMTVREVLIKLGIALRSIHEDTLVEGVIQTAFENGGITFITDVRFPNEVKRIKECGGIVIKINRPGMPLSTDPADSALASMPDCEWDYVFENDVPDLKSLDSKVASELLPLIRSKL